MSPTSFLTGTVTLACAVTHSQMQKAQTCLNKLQRGNQNPCSLCGQELDLACKAAWMNLFLYNVVMEVSRLAQCSHGGANSMTIGL